MPTPRGKRSGTGTNIFRLYRGRFLGDAGASWALGLRERVHSQFLRVSIAFARRTEEEGRLDEAEDWYRRILERDSMAEPCHRGLISILAGQGRDAEALDAYYRCRDLLRAELGIEPSPMTRALVENLKG